MNDDEEMIVRQRLSLQKTREIRGKLRMIAFMIGIMAMSSIVVFGFDAAVELTIINILFIVLAFFAVALTISVVLTLLSRWLVKRAMQEEME